MNRYKMIVPVGDVSDGYIVTKIRGVKKYRVKRSIEVYSEDGSKQTIKAELGCVFLVSTEMGFSILAVSKDLEVVWELTYSELKNYADSRSRGGL
jgi:hypothetical protein